MSVENLPKLLHCLDGALSFHFYEGDLEIPELCKKWIIRNNPNDPYDVTINHEAVDEVLEKMDVVKIRERRKSYECFLEEALLNMELNNDPGISFTRIILQLPLYTSFDPGQCLNLFDFLERRLLLQKVEKRLKSKRIYDLITGYVCRWKYQNNKRHGIRDLNIVFGNKAARNSYTESFQAGKPPTIHISNAEDNDDYNEDPFDDNYSILSKRVDRLELLSRISTNDDSVTSGVYVPSTPLNTYNHGQSDGQYATETHNQPIPKIYMELARSRKSSNASIDSRKEESNSNNAEIELLDLTEFGERLSSTSWADAYKQMQDEQFSEMRKQNSKDE